MKIVYFEPMSAPDMPNTTPFIRSSHGEGCGAENCKCSEGFWISISDGHKGVRFDFDTFSEMQMFEYDIASLKRMADLG